MPPAPPLDALPPEIWWAPFDPARDGAFDLRRAAHLYRRAGFGAPLAEVERAVAEGLDATLGFLLADPGPPDPLARAAAFALAGRLDRAPLRGLQARWAARMVESPFPLVERAALVWHDHFATSLAKVQSVVLMDRHVQTLRAHALGRFDALLGALARDGAMLVWLDGAVSQRARPNENFARELFELFTLGREGGYGEDDVRDAARALTGWRVEGDEVRFVPAEHDDGPKRVLGVEGRLGVDEVIRAALARPAASRWVARRLCSAFVLPDPPAPLLEPLAARLRASGFDIRDALGAVLRSRLFFSDHAIGRRIAGPLDYALAAVIALDARIDPRFLGEAIEGMGMSLFQPPDVSGWKGGESWLGAASLAARARFAEALTALPSGAAGSARGRWDPLAALAGRGLDAPEALVDHFAARLLARAPEPAARAVLARFVREAPGDLEARVRGLVRLLLAMPEAHLG